MIGGGGVVLKRGGRVMGKKYRWGGVWDRNGGVEWDEIEEWIGILGMSCRRRSRKGRGVWVLKGMMRLDW